MSRHVSPTIDNALSSQLELAFEDNRESVTWQVKQIEAELKPVVDHWDAQILPVHDSARLWRELIDFQAWPDALLTFKANLLPSATADFCRLADARPEKLILQAHAGNVPSSAAFQTISCRSMPAPAKARGGIA